MMKHRPFSIFLSSLFICAFLLLNVLGYNAPWMKEGARIEYAADVDYISFYFFDKSMIPEILLNLPGVNVDGGNSSIVSLSFEGGIGCRLSLVIKEVNNSIGLFEVTLEIGPYVSKRDLWVNLSTRQVTSLDGTPLGQTIIWIQPCGERDVIRYVGQYNSTVYAEVTHSPIPIETPQGHQDALDLVAVEHQSHGYEGIRLDIQMTCCHSISFTKSFKQIWPCS